MTRKITTGFEKIAAVLTQQTKTFEQCERIMDVNEAKGEAFHEELGALISKYLDLNVHPYVIENFLVESKEWMESLQDNGESR